MVRSEYEISYFRYGPFADDADSEHFGYFGVACEAGIEYLCVKLSTGLTLSFTDGNVVMLASGGVEFLERRLIIDVYR